MRTLLPCAVSILLAGCVITPPSPGFLDTWQGRVRIIDIPAAGGRHLRMTSTVVRTPAEFEAVLDRATSELGAPAAAGFVRPLKEGQPDFDRQLLVLVRHDESSGSTFRFSASVARSRNLICKVRTRRLGTNRDMVPYWFAVAVDKGAATRVEVWVDGELQEELAPREP